MAKKKQSKKQMRIIKRGRVYIVASFNNTLITVTDIEGKPVLSGSCGMYGFSGTRKSTPYAATVTVEAVLKKAMAENRLQEAEIFIKGIGPGRDAALRVLKNIGIDIVKIVDVTPVPHNGVRPPKLRRA